MQKVKEIKIKAVEGQAYVQVNVKNLFLDFEGELIPLEEKQAIMSLLKTKELECKIDEYSDENVDAYVSKKFPFSEVVNITEVQNEFLEWAKVARDTVLNFRQPFSEVAEAPERKGCFCNGGLLDEPKILCSKKFSQVA